MSTIDPASSLRNDSNVPEKAEAMLQLMCEIDTGIRSANESGWISEEDLREHIHRRSIPERTINEAR